MFKGFSMLIWFLRRVVYKARYGNIIIIRDLIDL